MMESRFVLSTVGISILLQMAEDREQQDLLNRVSNDKNIIDPSLLEIVKNLSEKAKEVLQKGNIKSHRNLSAELNGLYGLYGDDLSKDSVDVHWLIATDTTLGRYTANVVKEFLESKSFTQVQVYPPENLSTVSSHQFVQGMQHLMKWCEETIPGYKERGYQVIFNLTGGFKSLQGYLNIVGMFYADEIVYIFERSAELLRIPHLPIQIDPTPIQNYATQLAMMEHGHMFPVDELSGLPDGMLDIDKGDAIISDWGLLVWNRLRSDIFQKALLPFPRLVYLPEFHRFFERADRQERVKLQESLAKIAYLLEGSGGNTAKLKGDGGVLYENYQHQQDPQGKPIGHFRVSLGLRVSCTAKDGKLYLRKFGKEPDVNRNP